MERDGVEYVILGTAHVSRASVQAVDALLASEHFDAVAVELCPSRAHGIRDPEAFKQMDLFQVIRQGKAGMVAAIRGRSDVSIGIPCSRAIRRYAADCASGVNPMSR